MNHFYVGICGYPLAGKTELARLMAQHPDVVEVDSGRPLRDACKALYGVSEEDVATQEGKARTVEVSGQDFTVRQLLGDLGELLEWYYGDWVLTDLVVKRAERLYPGRQIIVFSGTRKNQARYLKRIGGMLIEVVRAGAVQQFEFDRYDRYGIDFTVDNNGTVEDLRSQAYELVLEARKRMQNLNTKRRY